MIKQIMVLFKVIFSLCCNNWKTKLKIGKTYTFLCLLIVMRKNFVSISFWFLFLETHLNRIFEETETILPFVYINQLSTCWIVCKKTQRKKIDGHFVIRNRNVNFPLKSRPQNIKFNKLDPALIILRARLIHKPRTSLDLPQLPLAYIVQMKFFQVLIHHEIRQKENAEYQFRNKNWQQSRAK
jgi:hypothetical protein